MFEREERAVDFEASDVGQAKRRACPFKILAHPAVRSGFPGDVRERPVLLTTLERPVRNGYPGALDRPHPIRSMHVRPTKASGPTAEPASSSSSRTSSISAPRGAG
jgi:hypothetical protein